MTSEKMKHRALIVGAALYATVAVMTFGHSAADSYREGTGQLGACRQEQLTNSRMICFDDRLFESAFGGVAAAILWPLYWSWEAQQ